MWCRGCLRFSWIYMLGLALFCGFMAGLGTAQTTTTITPDGYLGTEITLSGGTYEITGGTRPHGGRNVFHGFDRFQIGTGDTAHFAGAPDIEHIIGRVTGGYRSEIDGRLSSDATLFLLNPHGMIFGPNASLDVRGSFYASTADVIHFEDGSAFRADPGTPSTLTVAPPIAFGFLGGNPRPTEPMALRGSNLRVPEGETLSLVGGAIAIAGGQLQARGGTVHVASVTSGAADLNVPLPAVGSAGDVIAQSGNRLGDITLSQGAFLDASGNGGGTIVIRGGSLRMDRSIMTADNFSNADSPGRGIDIGVTNAVEVKNMSKISTVAVKAGKASDVKVRANAAVIVARSSVTTSSSATGASGSVLIEAPRISLTDGAWIGTTTQSGSGGDVRITANERVAVTHNASLKSSSGPGGLAGDILIDAKSVAIGNADSIAGQPGIFSSGQGGNISIVADKVALAHGTISSQDGNIGIIADEVTLANGIISWRGATADRRGTVTIQSQRVALTQGAAVATTAKSGSAGGDIQILADRLTLDNATLTSSASAGSRAGTVTLRGQYIAIVDRSPDAVQAGIFSTGQAGHVGIVANEVRLANGVIVARSTPAGRGGDVTVHGNRLDLIDGASINTGGSQQVPVGDVIVRVEDVTLENASIFSRSNLSPGNVLIAANRSISLLERENSGVEAGIFSFGGRDLDQTFGQVELTTPRLTMDGGTIGTPSRLSISVRAGNVNIQVGQLMLQGQALINTSTSNNQDAGMVRIQAVNVSLTQGATISAETTGSGDAGQIEIAVDRALMLSEASRITSNTTGQGKAGSIDIAVDALTLQQNSEITTAALQADGGNITIQGRRVVLKDSAVTTATDRGGSGGNIHIVTAGGVVALVGSEVKTSADIGKGGDIIIGTLLVDAESRLDASGRVDDGEVELGTVVNLGAVTPLPQTFAADAPLFNEPCAQRLRGGQVSSFVVAGRAGLPADPSSALPTHMIEEPMREAIERRGDRAAVYGPGRPAALAHTAPGEDAVAAWLQTMHAYPCKRGESGQPAVQYSP